MVLLIKSNRKKFFKVLYKELKSIEKYLEKHREKLGKNDLIRLREALQIISNLISIDDIDDVKSKKQWQTLCRILEVYYLEWSSLKEKS